MRTGEKSRVTLKDISQRCGYTATTVSRAMRDDPKLPEATRKKIRDVAREMGYIHNTVAASLRSGTSHMIAVIVNNVQNPYFSIMLGRADALLRAEGYNMMILCSQEDEKLARQMIRLAISYNVDGILYTPYNEDPESARLLIDSGVPFVMLDRRLDGVVVDSVRCDDYDGGLQAGRSLTALGHRRFVYIAGATFSSSEIDRRRGLLDALHEAGVPEANVRIISWQDFILAQAEDRVAALLLPVDYTAVVAFSDELALHVLNTYRDLGVGVPEAVSVISFDHIRGSLPYSSRVTSVGPAVGSIAECSVDFLLSRIRDRALPPQVKVLPVTIYDEGTTAPAH